MPSDIKGARKVFYFINVKIKFNGSKRMEMEMISNPKYFDLMSIDCHC
jgi:hypothetical protein